MVTADIQRKLSYVLLAVGILILPQLINSAYMMLIVNLSLMYVVVVLGLYFTLGLTGQLSVAQAAFWGIGAYASALLTVNYGVPIPVGMLAGALLAGVFGLLVGIPTLRLKGLYLAMVTIAFVQIVYLVLMNWMEVTHGPNGIARIPTPNLGFIQLSTSWEHYYYLTAILIILVIVARNITASTLGKAMMAVRESQIAAEAMGINATKIKLMAFILGAMYAGIGGGLYAHRMTYIDPDLFTYDETIFILVALLIGGRASIAGALLGGALVSFLPEWLRFMKEYYMAIYGASVVVLMVFLPMGLVSLPQKIRGQWQKRRGLKTDAEAAAAEAESVKAEPSAQRYSELFTQHPQTEGALLDVKNVTQQFGGLIAVNDVSIDIVPGEIRGLIGPNGSGKTTLMNVISGIYRPRTGTVKFLGQELVGKSVCRIGQMGMSRTFQTIRLFDDISVVENVMAARYFNSRANMADIVLRTPKFKREEKMFTEQSMAALEAVGMIDLADSTAGTLPYGKRRLLEIARAIATHPQLVLLDEPAAGMNPREKEQLMEIIRKIKDIGITIMLIEHDMSVVMGLADRVACLNFGKKIADGTPEEIQQNELVVEAYLGRKDVDA